MAVRLFVIFFVKLCLFVFQKLYWSETIWRSRWDKVSIPFYESAHWWGNKLNGRRQHNKLPDMWEYRKKKKSCCYCDVVGSNTRNVPITNTHDHVWIALWFLFFFSLSEGRVRSQTALLTQKQLEIHSPEPAAVTSPHRSLLAGRGAKVYARLFLCCCCCCCCVSKRAAIESPR